MRPKLISMTTVALAGTAGQRRARRMPAAALIAVVILAAGVRPADATPRLTIYDDGLACPGGCDAHVVFHPTLNGTAFAHAPASKPGAYDKCVVGSECRICFDGANDCMTIMYRGDGPHPNAFDFTPAFYEAQCPRPDAPASVAAQCKMLERATKRLDGRINCIRAPEHPQCVALIAAARAAQARDRTRYDECVRLGATAFNATRPVAEQRSGDCAYEKKGTGANSRGKTWKRLLPGGCRDGTYVGPNGTDCCTGNVFADGPQGVECSAFYPAP